ncbi:MAG: CHASE2 domain-containing protein [Geitlerinemataceae cyanobacterium]
MANLSPNFDSMWHELRNQIDKWRGILTVAPSVAVFVIAGNALGVFQLVEWATLDQFFSWRPVERLDDRITIVTVDEPDIQHIGQWPMSDRTMAQLLKAIRAQQPRAIGLDIYRDLPLEPGHQELIEVFESTPNLIGIEKVSGDTVDAPPALSKKGQVAAADMVGDADGKVRRSLIVLQTQENETRESLGTKLALMYLEAENVDLELLDRDRQVYQLGRARFHRLTGEEGGYVGTATDAGGYQILLNYRGELQDFQTISMTDVLENRIPADLMRDRLVFIGATTPSLKDIFQTPYNNALFAEPTQMPGIVVHANIASQILSAALEGRPLLRASGSLFGDWAFLPKSLQFVRWFVGPNGLWIGLWSFVGAAGGWLLLQTRVFNKNIFLVGTLVAIVAATGVLISIGYVAFLGGWVIPVFSPFLALSASAMWIANYHHRWQLQIANRRLAAANNKLEEANQQLGRANVQLEEYSQTLETKVNERTQELQNTLDRLQATQDELILSEKMAALGQLVAGIAHEINTPLGAINSSVRNISNFWQDYLDKLPEFFRNLSNDRQSDFLTLIQKSSQQEMSLSTREQRKIKKDLTAQLKSANIQNATSIAGTLVTIGLYDNIDPLLPLLKDADSPAILKMAYQLANVQSSTKTIVTAAERAGKIVFALKTYARYDRTGEKTTANIIDGIETILTLYQNQIKHGVELIRKVEDSLPNISCYPDELNQVWTNLIHNALQAMNNKGTLEIEVRQQDGNIEVSITDSGAGIPPEVLPKIFQPFFTTKPPGEGSGLGLDIVRKIIEKHQGTIGVDSVPGKTTFTISLPIDCK